MIIDGHDYQAAVWDVTSAYHPDSDQFDAELNWPERWINPRVVVVGDIFTGTLPYPALRHVWQMMIIAKKHLFLLTTTHPDQMTAFLTAKQAEEQEHADFWDNVAPERRDAPAARAARQHAATPPANIRITVQATWPSDPMTGYLRQVAIRFSREHGSMWGAGEVVQFLTSAMLERGIDPDTSGCEASNVEETIK